MEFYIGQIFEGTYPTDAAAWCNGNNAHIEETTADGAEQRQFTIVANPAPPKPTPEEIVAQYDAAMENYMKEVRTARGYTTREPSDYINSSVGRWRQDAMDWITFRDAVLSYAMEIENMAMETGAIPSMEDFLAGMPQITWSYDAENGDSGENGTGEDAGAGENTPEEEAPAETPENGAETETPE